jgi:NADH dehydrogenase (ubiquinone) 1 beta subcomplex subunit 9
MDASFRAVTAFYKRVPIKLDHKTAVTRLYRRCLKTLLSWEDEREIINEDAADIRRRFEAARNVEMPVALRLINEAEAELHVFAHPDPYTIPYMPGGSKFMRNAPPSLEVRANTL